MKRVLFLVSLFLAGCGMRDSKPKDVTDQMLVGVWDSMGGDPEVCRERFIFGSDGSFTHYSSEGNQYGSYARNGDNIDLTYAQKNAEHAPFSLESGRRLSVFTQGDLKYFVRVPDSYASSKPCPEGNGGTSPTPPTNPNQCGGKGNCNCKCGNNTTVTVIVNNNADCFGKPPQPPTTQQPPPPTPQPPTTPCPPTPPCPPCPDCPKPTPTPQPPCPPCPPTPPCPPCPPCPPTTPCPPCPDCPKPTPTPQPPCPPCPDCPPDPGQRPPNPGQQSPNPGQWPPDPKDPGKYGRVYTENYS